MSPLNDLTELDEGQLALLLDDVFDPLIVTDPLGNVVYLNSAAKGLYGFERLATEDLESPDLQDYVRQTFALSTVTGEAVPEDQQPLTRALRGKRFRDAELRVRHKESGEERVFAFSGSCIEGQPPLPVLTIRDVTGRHQAERRYRISFETNPAPTFVARLEDALLLDFNEGFLEMTGIDQDRANGRSLMEIGLLPDKDELERVLASLRMGRVVDNRQTTIERRGAGARDVMVSARAIEIEGEECAIFTFLDVTELLEAQRTLREHAAELLVLSDELDAFNNSIAHELRTPLRGIHGFSHALLEDYGDRLDAEGRRYIGRIKAAAVRIGEHIGSIQTLSRVTRSELSPSEVDLGELAREVARRLREEEPGRVVSFEIAPELPTYGDAGLLHILMTKLLENAWKFTRDTDEARVEVGAERRGDETVYFVRDNGVGFEGKYAAKLFEPFQRLHRPEEFDGQGIGLAVAQRIVFRHRGLLWAEGGVGEGASFYFTLPAAG